LNAGGNIALVTQGEHCEQGKKTNIFVSNLNWIAYCRMVLVEEVPIASSQNTGDQVFDAYFPR
jgi:hypothetical protein